MNRERRTSIACNGIVAAASVCDTDVMCNLAKRMLDELIEWDYDKEIVDFATAEVNEIQSALDAE